MASSILSFVFRVLELTESESLYLGSVVLLLKYGFHLSYCSKRLSSWALTPGSSSLIEMDIALVVCSAPAFAAFMRVYILQSPSIRSLLPGRSKDTSSMEAVPDPNKPRTGWNMEQRAGLQRLRGQDGMSDTWLFDSRAISDVETQTRRPDSHERDDQ